MDDKSKPVELRDLVIGVIVGAIIFSLGRLIANGEWEVFIAYGLEVVSIVLLWFAYDLNPDKEDDETEEKSKK